MHHILLQHIQALFQKGALIPARNPIEFDLDELGLLMIPELLYRSRRLLVSCDTLLMIVNGPSCKSKLATNESNCSRKIQTSLTKLINHGVAVSKCSVPFFSKLDKRSTSSFSYKSVWLCRPFVLGVIINRNCLPMILSNICSLQHHQHIKRKKNCIFLNDDT
jgi:hypothetical protein